jgi:peptidoglycan L-alanyl-D-glutamate endopeptidase CwlK
VSTRKTFVLGAKSLAVLRPVHPDLYAVVRLAIRLTRQDFAVFEGLRTRARQALLIKDGKSWTYNSRHLTGHAVDLVPWIDGELVWDRPAALVVGAAVHQAARQLGIPIRSGYDWDQDERLEEAGETDYVHHELPRNDYPEPWVEAA